MRTGASNLAAHIGIRKYGIPAVVAINSFPTDTPGEVEAIRDVALAAGARDAVVATHFTDGGAGATDLAEAVWAATQDPSRSFKLLYTDEAPLGEKILTIVKEIYGGDGIEPTPAAQKSLKLYESMGFGDLPICMAKTQYSISHDAALKGAPKVHGADPRDPALGRRRVRDPTVRRDADDAGSALEAGRREDRHRRRRKCQRFRPRRGRRRPRSPRDPELRRRQGRFPDDSETKEDT